MNEILIYFVLGGLIFLFVFIIIIVIGKKLRKIWEKQYIPETATSFKCIDGHIVRSKGELIIDNYLYTHGIKHEYEKRIKISGNSVTYDWYLTEFDIYIEYWGYYGKNYMKRKEEKLKLYKKGKLNLISVEDIMFKDINYHLEKLLKQYVKCLDSKKHCPNCGVLLDDRF